MTPTVRRLHAALPRIALAIGFTALAGCASDHGQRPLPTPHLPPAGYVGGGGYGFPKGHAADYAVIAVETAYLKAHYPVEYMTALLSVTKENIDKIAFYVAALRPCVSSFL